MTSEVSRVESTVARRIVMIKGKKGLYVDFTIMWFLDRNETLYPDSLIAADSPQGSNAFLFL